MTDDITNDQRAAWAVHGVLQYAIGKEGGEELYDDPETVLTDLLTDLRHYADREAIDFKTCLDRAEMHYDAEIAEECGNQFGLRCPECGKGDEIDIAATVWVRLCPDGTDVTAASNGDHEWSDHSGALCASCGYGGNVDQFSKPAAAKGISADPGDRVRCITQLADALATAIKAMNVVPGFDTRIADPGNPGRTLSSYQLLPQLEATLKTARKQS